MPLHLKDHPTNEDALKGQHDAHGSLDLTNHPVRVHHGDVVGRCNHQLGGQRARRDRRAGKAHGQGAACTFQLPRFSLPSCPFELEWNSEMETTISGLYRDYFLRIHSIIPKLTKGQLLEHPVDEAWAKLRGTELPGGSLG